MNQISNELSIIAEQLDSIRAEFDSDTVRGPLQKLEEAANKIGKAWSGSSLGYHSRVYYRDFQSPPPGAHFSQEWGMMQYFTDGTTGEWRECDYDEVQRKIYELAGQPDLKNARSLAEQARNLISDKRIELASLISTAQNKGDDAFLSKLRTEIEEVTIPTASNIVKGYFPRGQLVTRDTVAAGQGFQSPPHLGVWADVMALRVPMKICEDLSKTARIAAKHISRIEHKSPKRQITGVNIFIGHGRSSIWRDLKEFIQDRLHLPWDEFNRVPIAGITNITRLTQMLDDVG